MTEYYTNYLQSDLVKSFHGPHEIHVSVKPSTTSIDKFTQTCSLLGIKAQVIYNARPKMPSLVDFITVSQLKCSTPRAWQEMKRISTALRQSGYTVIREKIETVPWHPLAKSIDQVASQAYGLYFESHLKINRPLKKMLYRKIFTPDAPLYLSASYRNIHRQTFATFRRYMMNKTNFQKELDKIYINLSISLDIEKPTTELAIYDSNPTHDNKWIRAFTFLQL